MILIRKLSFSSFFHFKVDQDDIDLLLKDASINSIRKYAELPDSDNFLTDDAYVLSPAKYVNYSDYLLSFYNRWDESELNRQHAKLTLLYGTLNEKIGKNSQVESRPNLRFFLKIRDDYPDVTKASFRIPTFLRYFISLFLPGSFKLKNRIIIF